MPKAAIITIGDEILRGRIIDTNSAWLAKKLFLLGVDVIHHQTVPDRLDAISKALSYVDEADIIITTGGLGPTPDDARRCKASCAAWCDGEVARSKKCCQKLD